jgi:DNA-binding transcriptional LysR family regulator
LRSSTPALLLSNERLVQETTRSRRGMEGRSVVGAVATAVTSEILTAALNECAARHPHVRVMIEEMPLPLPLPGRGEIDLGLAHAYIGREECDDLRVLANIGLTPRDVLSREREVNPAVRVVKELLKAAATPKKTVQQKRVAVS